MSDEGTKEPGEFDRTINKKLAQMRAVIDQGVMALRECAPVLWEFHKALVDQGFTRDEAMLIVTQWFLQSSK